LSLAIKSERNASKSNNAVLIEAGKNKRQAFWVYLGQKQEGKWQSRYFDIDGLPALNSVIKSHANVFQHETKPVYRDDLYEWDLGKIKGTIKAGSTVTVVDTLTLIGNNYWAKVK
jgi:hypothetical protein